MARRVQSGRSVKASIFIRSFADGLALCPPYHSDRKATQKGFNGDADAIKSDWKAVGSDISFAIDEWAEKYG